MIRFRKHLLREIFILTLILLTLPTMVDACDCRSPLLITSYNSSDVVVRGKVISVSNYYLDQTQEYLDSMSEKDKSIYDIQTSVREYKISVAFNYKNSILTDTISIRTNNYSSCKLYLKIGENYIIFAKNINYLDDLYDPFTKNNVFQSNQCSLTSEYSIGMSKKLKILKAYTTK